ncbi:MAG: hypothetical protein AB1689_25420 [Thermodesulfobacteriota bacterium]
MPSRPRGRTGASWPAVVLALPAVLAGVCAPSRGAAAQPQAVIAPAPPTRAIRIERETFWYDTTEPQLAAGGTDWSAPGAVRRLAEAIDDVLARHAGVFPQPPPVDTAIRAPDRRQMGESFLWSRWLGSYGCARLVDGVVVVEVAPSAFVGRDALNDAELRSFLAHELVHAYQFGRGDHGDDHAEIARREVEALEWEIAHLEPDVRASYRDDLAFNLEMYRGMLGP